MREGCGRIGARPIDPLGQFGRQIGLNFSLGYIQQMKKYSRISLCTYEKAVENGGFRDLF